ncbi:MAG: methyltransferase domain-containing protein [Chloroflexota bacterium]|nr:methyltransferase domain-containing protein [Chloroflexota bacterium]MDE2921158.1 methyltransferase domain-containing protein [Chloroflexota bacterium]
MGADWYAQRGFAPETVRRARAWYLRFIPEPGDLLDLGCGRGEFLRAAAEAGHRVLGLDHDQAMLAEAHGLPVREADALDFLQSTPDRYDSITAFHVIEHLAVREAEALVRLAADRLRPGGRLVIATLNPGSLPTLAHEFWRDPTHVRPYDWELIEFLTTGSGLETVSAGVNPESERGLPVDLADLDLEPPTPDEGASSPSTSRASRGVAARPADSDYGQDLERAIHDVSDGLLHTRQELARIASVVRRFLEVAYEPSELYVVARRP